MIGTHLLAPSYTFVFLYYGSYLHIHLLYSLGEPEGYACPDHLPHIYLHQSQQVLNLLEKDNKNKNKENDLQGLYEQRINKMGGIQGGKKRDQSCSLTEYVAIEHVLTLA